MDFLVRYISKRVKIHTLIIKIVEIFFKIYPKRLNSLFLGNDCKEKGEGKR